MLDSSSCWAYYCVWHTIQLKRHAFHQWFPQGLVSSLIICVAIRCNILRSNNRDFIFIYLCNLFISKGWWPVSSTRARQRLGTGGRRTLIKWAEVYNKNMQTPSKPYILWDSTHLKPSWSRPPRLCIAAFHAITITVATPFGPRVDRGFGRSANLRDGAPPGEARRAMKIPNGQTRSFSWRLFKELLPQMIWACLRSQREPEEEVLRGKKKWWCGPWSSGTIRLLSAILWKNIADGLSFLKLKKEEEEGWGKKKWCGLWRFRTNGLLSGALFERRLEMDSGSLIDDENNQKRGGPPRKKEWCEPWRSYTNNALLSGILGDGDCGKKHKTPRWR